MRSFKFPLQFIFLLWGIIFVTLLFLCPKRIYAEETSPLSDTTYGVTSVLMTILTTRGNVVSTPAEQSGTSYILPHPQTEPQIVQKTSDPKETWISQDIVDICEKIGPKNNLSPELLEAVIESESSGQQYAANGNCVGLMQVNKNLHAKRMQSLGYTDIWNKEANIATGANLLSELCNKYGSVGRGLMAYNGTPKAGSRSSLTPYASKILKRKEELERVHRK